LKVAAMIATNFSTMSKPPFGPLAPNDFSHSVGLLSRSLSYGSDAGSFRWTPITDTIKFFKWIVGYCPLRAMTESSFGKIVSITNAGGMDISASPVLRTSFTYTGREWEEDVGLFYYRARWYDPSVGRFLQEDSDPGQVVSPITVINKYIYIGNNPILGTDPTGEFVFLLLFVGSLFTESLIGATAAAMLAGAMSSLAVVELGKYHGNTEQMMDKESPESIIGMATLGAFAGWIGQAVKSATALYYSGLSKGAVSFVSGAAGGAAASTTITTGLDASHSMPVTGQDYANAIFWGGLVGGAAGFSNWYFKSNIALPIVGAANGSVTIYTSYVPSDDKRK